MKVMEKQIKESGDALTSAIVASAKESAVANAALLAVMTAMSNNLLRHYSYSSTIFTETLTLIPNPIPKFLKFSILKNFNFL
jgi:hypothetical protein